ncbi:MAG TPA: ABC transporter permease [Saprospiraceae bacterium]|nr:ABC transporter permease [Saprospiraceae bacterium]
MNSIKAGTGSTWRLIVFTLFKLWLAGSICFILSRSTPGDPLEQYLGYPAENRYIAENAQWEQELQKYRAAYHLDRPLFYFSIQFRYPDFIAQLPSDKIQHHLRHFFYSYRNEAQLKAYYNQLLQLKKHISGLDNRSTRNILESKWSDILKSHDVESSQQEMKALIAQVNARTEKKFNPISWEKNTGSAWAYLWPQLQWHGFNNQYHHWMTDALTGKWGKSLRDGEPITSKIFPALGWTLSINLPALLLALFVGVFSGLRAGMRPHSGKFSRYLSLVFFALPVYALATLLILFFTKSGWLPVFSSVVRPPSEITVLDFWRYFTLPVLCLTAGVWAFIHQQLSTQVEKTRKAPYVSAAYFRGVPDSVVKWKYIFPNSIFPLITSLTILLPGLLAGALAVEFIFDIPGMGKLLYDSLLGKDWPVVFMLIFLNMGIIILVNSLADLLYLKYDPRREQLQYKQVI